MATERHPTDGRAQGTLTRRMFLCAGALGALCAARPLQAHGQAAPRHPNIVYILVDDLGYGDVSCLNPNSKIHTAHLDRLAADGMRLLDAHSPSAVCTPTRYSVLTGRYPWRSPLKESVLWGYSPPLIPSERMTVPAMLRDHGYHTACIGKWHLGLDWGTTEPGAVPSERTVDFSKPVGGGPNEIGFDHAYILPSSLDIPPYVYVENGRVEELPTARYPGEGGQAFMRPGPCPPGFAPEDVMPHLTGKAVDYISERAESGEPFFLYYPMTSPHTPIVPNEPYRGRSGIGDYGDFVLEMDACVGRILDALDAHGLTESTLVIFTSDNGCSPEADFDALAEHGHAPSYHFRGHKADIFEGGHRIPFIARWPGTIPAGSRSTETICLTDLMATAAAIVGADIPPDAGEDSFDILPALRGAAGPDPIRDTAVQASINGALSIRQGHWKLIMSPGSGGWSAPRPETARDGSLPPVQLYDLDEDPGESRNLWEKHPEIVRSLAATLAGLVADGRSTPGPRQENDGETSMWGPAGVPPGGDFLDDLEPVRHHAR